MTRQSHRVEFIGHAGNSLAGILELPSHEPDGVMLFSHCFTCNKDLKAIVRISRGLSELGWGVLRFDFSGLGNSRGNFADSNFSTNCEDLRCAAEFLRAHHRAPDFLIGHSFGGAASFAMAGKIESVLGVIGLAAPSNTHHLASLLCRMDPNIELTGQGTVTIGGQSFNVNRQMIDDFRSHDLALTIAALQKPMLVFHSPTDETVGFQHALVNCGYATSNAEVSEIDFRMRSLIALPRSNHLLTNDPRDIEFIVATIDRWCRRMK